MKTFTKLVKELLSDEIFRHMPKEALCDIVSYKLKTLRKYWYRLVDRSARLNKLSISI